MNMVVSTVADFLQYLSFLKIDRPVIDRTGLDGYWDFQLIPELT